VLDGVARFRPIVLTSLTTFVGLLPLMMEQSVQAQFLIPMAISLGFGVLFATAVTLLVVPCGYNSWCWRTSAGFGGDCVGRAIQCVGLDNPAL
jgi:multidrug efflux pump subunit AcrB